MRSVLRHLRRTKIWGIALGGVVALTGPVEAKSAGAGKLPAMTAVELVPALHAINQLGIRAGRTAQERGASEAARQYGATLSRDYEAADRNLKRYADEENIELDGKISPRVEATLQHANSELANLSTVGGQAFDQEFASVMLLDHQQAIQMVDRAWPATTDPKLKALLGEVEPNLREHEQIASYILSGFAGPSGESTGRRCAGPPTTRSR
ncbi:MAG TPA: DUF4142 domain-containing protein [Polyangia bacterium]|nr:DUF4142 domain-containing protein [Polyangia bacterium]